MESSSRGVSIPTKCLTKNTLDQSRNANQDPPQIKTKTNSSTPLQMCQPHKCTIFSVSELEFSQTFFKGIFTLFTMPLDPSNIAMLDRSSGTR
jgi:hypothetical protein